MSIQTENTIRATFHVVDGTDKKKFQESIRKVYDGSAEEDEVQYVLDHVEKIVCGHDGQVMANAARKRWDR